VELDITGGGRRSPEKSSATTSHRGHQSGDQEPPASPVPSVLNGGPETRVAWPAVPDHPDWCPGATLSRTIFRVIDADHLLMSSSRRGLAGRAARHGAVFGGQLSDLLRRPVLLRHDDCHRPRRRAAARIYVGGDPHNFSPNAAPNLSEAPCNVFPRPAARRTTTGAANDAGKTWASISQGDGASSSLHSDDHAYAFGADGSVYDGNDGGIWRSPNRGVSWTTMNTNIAIHAVPGRGPAPTNKGIVLGGTQDNGTNLRNESLQEPPSGSMRISGTAACPSSISRRRRACSTPILIRRSISWACAVDIGGAGGARELAVRRRYFGYGPAYYNGMDPTDPVSFYAPLTQHPAFTPNVIYFGSNRVYRSPDPKRSPTRRPRGPREPGAHETDRTGPA